jgi:SAM-dependent methyltransferase
MTWLRSSSSSVDTKYYEAMKPDSLAEWLGTRARDRIYDDFIRICRPEPRDTILDVGVSDVVGNAANVLERRYPHPEYVTAVGLSAADEFRAAFPKVTYRQIAANQPLPFPDKSFDIVASNAVLEHVGSPEKQRRFVADLMRVGRRLFITVPNRFFPIEPHTAMPFLHWTDSGFALMCRLLGKHDWSRQENLILMSRWRLLAACPPEVTIRVGKTGILFGPCSSNLYLYAGD